MNELAPYRKVEITHVEECKSCAVKAERSKARGLAWRKTGWPLTKYSLARMPIIAAVVGILSAHFSGTLIASGWEALAVVYGAGVGLRVGYKIITAIFPASYDDYDGPEFNPDRQL